MGKAEDAGNEPLCVRKKAVRENTEIKKNRKPNGRRAAMDMEKVQAVFLCHKIKNQTEK